MNIPNIICTNIPKERKAYIKSCRRTFNKQFSMHLRNKVGKHLHMAGAITALLVSFLAISNIVKFLLLIMAKYNFDYVPQINNINKRKAAAFSHYMKKNNITDEKELIYGVKNYLINAGSFSYPIFHPNKIKKLAETEEYTKSKETGIILNRTDGKDLVTRLMKFKKRYNKKPEVSHQESDTSCQK